MDPLQNDWAGIGHEEDAAHEGSPQASAAAPDVTGVAASASSAPLVAPATPGEQRQTDPTRRRFDRGGRRRSDWPEDAGMTCCPGCGFESLQSLGMVDSGDYLWQCPQCDRRFNTGRATRTLL
jgi:hypothetical protein